MIACTTRMPLVRLPTVCEKFSVRPKPEDDEAASAMKAQPKSGVAVWVGLAVLEGVGEAVKVGVAEGESVPVAL